MACSKCGAELPANAFICRKCGTVVPKAASKQDTAQAAWTSPETQAAMEADGINMSSVWLDYFDEVGSGKPAHQ